LGGAGLYGRSARRGRGVNLIAFTATQNIVSPLLDLSPEAIIKLPNERIVLSIDFSNKLAATEQISSCKYDIIKQSTRESDTSVVQTIQASNADRGITFTVTGGTLGDVFTLFFVATKSLGGTIEKSLLLRIEEPVEDTLVIPVSSVSGSTMVGADFSGDMDVTETVLTGNASVLLLSNRNYIGSAQTAVEGRTGVTAAVPSSVIKEYPNEKFIVEVIGNTSKGNRFAKNVYVEAR
jgi:hypothetical protein